MHMILRLRRAFRAPLPPASRNRRQQGFSLVEMAIVLVIIGLLLGGILQGQSLIREMKVKDVMTIIKDLQTSSQYFKERYHYLPGDWVFTAGVIPGVVTGGNGNGLIDTAAEAALVPNHLFNAGYIRGGAGPIQTQYGAVTVISRATSSVPGLPASIQNVIQFANLPCDIAMEIDLKIDDGSLATGNAMASVAACTPNGANDPVPFFAVGL